MENEQTFPEQSSSEKNNDNPHTTGIHSGEGGIPLIKPKEELETEGKEKEPTTTLDKR